MRNTIVSAVLVGMMGAFGVLLYVQRDSNASAPVDKSVVAPVVAKPVGPPVAPPLSRALRTVSLGWELLAPGAIASSGSPSAFKAAGLETSFADAASMDEIAIALAKGGNEPNGADLALVPLSSYVASFERLRALSPEVIFVAGWSRGRESLYAADPAALAKLPATGTVHLAGTAAKPETFFSLFLLDLAGVRASRVEVDEHAPLGSLAAVFRVQGEHPAGKLLVTSAETPHLMPIVAIAPHGFVGAHAGELATWIRTWLAGVQRLEADVPAGGRQVAAMPGAPPVLGIIEALGQVEFANLRDNAEAFALSGRGAVTLDEIFKTTWRIWRDAGVITTPAPDVAPLDTTLVASLVRSSTSELPPPRAAIAEPSTKVLLVVRAPVSDAGTVDAEAFATRIGFVAGIFDRLPLRVAVRDDAKTTQLVTDTARGRFGLRTNQLATAKRPPNGLPGAIEVLSGR